MRLICPNCGAEYEVPEASIPPEGRDVRCGHCGTAWFQSRALAGDVSTEDDSGISASGPGANIITGQPLPRRREIDPAVLDVLRSEAARENSLRAGKGDEKQAPVKYEKAPEEAPTPQIRPAGPTRKTAPKEAHEDATAPRRKPKPAPAGRPSRRNLLPDVEEVVNSALGTPPPLTGKGQHPKGRAAFRIGLLLPLLVLALAVFVYLQSERIALSLPQLAPAMESYTGAVNSGRDWLSHEAMALKAVIEATVGTAKPH